MTDPVPDPLAQALAQLDGFRAALGDAAIDAAAEALRRHAPAARGAAAAAPARLRQVSILFADVADSTAMLGRVAPDEAMELLGEAVQGFAEAVQRWGGRVLRYTGDGIKAAFGSQGLHEDEAERAVRAGLQILEQAARHAARVRATLGIADFGVRVGIHTGAVLLGGGPEAERSAMGHAVHLAARMEQSAPVGRLRVSDATWAQVRGLFVADEQPSLQVKGHAAPLRTWLVHGVAEGPEPRVQRGLDGIDAPMVGRDRELAALRSLHARCSAEGRVGFAQVLADAGLGKTRLREEVLRALRLHEGHPGLLQARAQPSTAVQAHGLLHQLLARWFGIRDDIGAESARRRLVDGLVPWLGVDGDAQAAAVAEGDAARIGQLVGMDFAQHPAVQALTGAALRTQAFDALRRALQARAAAAPLLVVLDDLHWADAGSLAFVQALLQPAAVPLVVLVLARPTLREREPALQPAEGVETLTLSLAALAPTDGQALLGALLAGLPTWPAALAERLLPRAAGNPFFLEALVRMLVDDGVIDTRQRPWVLHEDRLAALRVPETLVAVLQARLDALPADELTALQRSSIVGPVFWDAALATIDARAPQALPLLGQRALVQPVPESTFDGTAEHRFVHALLHEVTYGTVLKAERQAGHAAVARWLAERVGERAGEFLALTAEHFERAGDSARALDYWDLAHVDAFRRFANEAALHAADRALAQPALRDPRWRYSLLANRLESLEGMGRSAEAEQVAAEMSAWAEQQDDDAMRADLLASRALVADHHGRSDEAARLADEAVRLGERAADDAAGAALALAHGERAWLATQRHDWPTVEREIAAALQAARRAARTPRRQMGYDGFQHQLRVIQLEALALQGRDADVVTAIEQALIEPGLRLRDRFNFLSRRAPSLRALGRFEEAEATSRQVLDLAGQAGMPRLRVFGLMQLAESALAGGRLGEAGSLADEAESLARSLDDAADAPGIAELQGRIAQAHGRHDEARRRWQDAVTGFVALGRMPEALATRCDLARLDLAEGVRDQALAAVDAVLAEAAPPMPGGAHGLGPAALVAAQAVLAAWGDARANVLLHELRARLDERLAALPDEAARRLLVQRVPHWAAVAALG